MDTSQQPPRIFVQIVSYRDGECHHTIRDLFEKAAHPERIFVGLCWQYDPAHDQEYLAVPYPRPEQVRVIQYHSRDAQGAGWARNEAQALWQGEEYTLQIQAHMRFVQGWDELLIEMLTRCPSKKSLISAYLPPYMPPDARWYEPNVIPRIRIRRLGDTRDAQMLYLTANSVQKDDGQRGGLYPSPFWIGNFLFAESKLLKEVPSDPHIYFFGEELAYSARLYTHGWDIYQPDALVMYHQWNRRETISKQGYRRMGNERNQRSLERVRHLLGFQPAQDEKAVVELEKYGLGSERPLQALWHFAGIDWHNHSITQDAEEGRWNFTPLSEKKPRIFVQIASYRDPECQWTVKDLFAKATNPERISVGICWQFIEGEDDICFKEPYARPNQVREYKIDARESKGVCWARAITQQLWRGEEFTLQIDSHMRFEPGWDELLLSMWKDCESEKAVLTSYPPGYTPPNDCEREWIFGMAAKEFDANDIFLMTGAPGFRTSSLPEKPIVGAFASACMLFGPASMIGDVPYDPYLYFFGEEISLAARLWTHGYDLFHPNRLVIFHDWDRSKRPTHFSDHNWNAPNARSFARVKHMLGTEISDDPNVTLELEKYGLGNERSLVEYQRYSGVDFGAKMISEKARAGKYERYQPGQLPKIFVNIASYRDPECQWTVKDLFEKAAHPERIFVGICWQFDEEEDKHCFEVSTRPEQVRIFPIDWRDAEGVCWARYQTQQLLDGEEYTLMIDSHMRFMPGWDTVMIEELEACDSKKPILSCSPPRYEPPNDLGKNINPTFRRVKPFFPDGNIRCQGELLDRAPEQPLRGYFIVANFVFSRSEVISEVPYDPYLYFDQEEITYSARLYTHGWDMFSPRRQFLYHFYNDKKVPTGSVRPLHWRDLHKADETKIRFYRDRGLRRFNHMTGFRHSNDAEVTRELDKFGFGKVRSLAQFEEATGVDFKHKIASDKALRGGFIENLSAYRTRPVYVPEIDDAKKKQVTAPPVVQSPSVEPALKISKLDAGDFVPMFEVTDTHEKKRGMEAYAGRHSLLFFLPLHDKQYLQHFFQRVSAHLGQIKSRDLWQLFILSDTVKNLQGLRVSHKIMPVLWSDPEGKILRAFGWNQAGEPSAPPLAYLVNPNLKIIRAYADHDADRMLSMLAQDFAQAIAGREEEKNTARVVSELPPGIIVPNVFSPEFCKKCIEIFHNGKTFDGFVGAGKKAAYKPDTKIRTDYIVEPPLLHEIDEKLSRSLFPEIKKVFGFDVTHRELYKIGLYTGDKKGFFRAHRDNFDSVQGCRRIALTIALSEDYEGGGLRFPEYDQHTYRPPLGAAIAFPCSTMHEALPVTKGSRYILVAFLHGDEDEAYRRHYNLKQNHPLKINQNTPALRKAPLLAQSRDFYTEWRKQHVHIDMPTDAPSNPKPASEQRSAPMAAPTIIQKSTGAHAPRKVLESKQAIVFDDFLPEDLYDKLYDHVLKADYERINTTGAIARAWHVHDGFPLRSQATIFYHAKNSGEKKTDFIYPSRTMFDPFIEHVLKAQPQVQHLTGKEGEWDHFSVTSWLYPPGTGLSLHDDGSGVYTGAYVFFLNPTWKLHWGGLLLMMDEEGNRNVHDFRNRNDQIDFFRKKWLQANNTDELLMEHGFAKCIFPKRNRMVFIANDAYHMVTRVNEAAGDNLRMSLAGFFDRKKHDEHKGNRNY